MAPTVRFGSTMVLCDNLRVFSSWQAAILGRQAQIAQEQTPIELVAIPIEDDS
jgi:hypothetical protein